MRVISAKLLRDYWAVHADVADAFKAWYAEAEMAQWQSPEDIKRAYPGASILPGNRVIFNIKGNSYRLIVQIHYNTKIVYIRFVGTHAEYDHIDAERI